MKKIYLSAFFVACIGLLSAQMNVGINTSSWGGVSNVSWNPAISDSKYIADISLGGGNSGFIQNYKGMTPGALFVNTNFDDIFGIGLMDSALFSAGRGRGNLTKSQNTDGKPVNLNQFSQIEGPGSFMVAFGDKKGMNNNAIAFSWHLNAARTIHGMDPNLGFFYEGLPSTVQSPPSNSFTIANAAWLDYDLTYGRTIYDKGKHFFKVGVTIKILHELEASTMAATLDNYSINGNQLTTGTGSSINTTYNNGTKISAAGDIGFEYEFRPEKDKYSYDIDSFHHLLPRYRNIYTLAIGFSVIDMGALPNGSPQQSAGGTLPFAGTIQASQFNVLDKAPLSYNDVNGGYSGPKTIGLPTRFNLYVDYNSKPGLGINLNTTISPVFKSSNPQISYGSSINLTPRFDLPLFGIYIPFTYNFNGNAGVGVALRGGPVWFGVSDLAGLARPNGMNNGVVYAAVKIPLIFHRKYDSDGDKVSNRYDRCPNEKGSWLTQGCADRDGDGVRDADDACPDLAGPIYLHGCPDMDGDSIPDREDSCPSVKGPRELHGCPDTDGDGILDKYDECPTQAGPAYLHGCPDMDGDSIADKYDDCPTVKGDRAHKGCPDSDGDGVYDNEDNCPHEFGPKENKGCPWPDTDGDGILDKDDLCPTEKGTAEFHGCPTPVHAPVGTNMTSIFDSLLFESGKSTLSSANLQILNIFATQMQTTNKNYNIMLIGHTDNVETDNDKLHQLSVDRAEAVRKVLMMKGVEDSRITVDGYGAEQPAADNSSAINRRFNRRVQLIIQVTGGQ